MEGSLGMSSRNLKIYCDGDESQREVHAWLNEYWGAEVKKVSLWTPDSLTEGTYGIFVDGAPQDLRDDLAEVFEGRVETDWEE